MTSKSMFMAVLFIDIWLFANPHVIATFSRIALDRVHAIRHWFLLYFLPILVLIGVTIAALAYGNEGLFTLYFIAQTFHVTRQSFGISRAYLKSVQDKKTQDPLSEALIYLIPIFGLAHRCSQQPAEFLGYTITLPSLPAFSVELIGLLSIVIFLSWTARLIASAKNSPNSKIQEQFVASHVLISFVAFFLCNDITEGWLIFNIWHNIQYLLFVWAQNVRHFHKKELKSKKDPNNFTEYLSPLNRFEIFLFNSTQKRKIIVNYTFFLIIGALLYQTLTYLGEQLIWLGLPTILILHFTFNYHHYLVDGIIWKRPGFIQNLFLTREK